jgi:cyanophycin synthetase
VLVSLPLCLDRHEESHMELRKVLVLRGPNVWACFPVLEAWVDLGALKDWPPDGLPGFAERLMAWLPSLVGHRCAAGRLPECFRRDTHLAHVLEHVALELQMRAGAEVGFGRTRPTSAEGVYKVAVQFDDADVGRAAVETARDLCLAAVHGLPFDAAAALGKLRALARRNRPGPGLAAVLAAARRRRIPVRRLGSDGLLQLGHGARQRRLLVPQTDRGSTLAASIAADSDLTRSLLRDVSVPVPGDAPPAGPTWRLLVVGRRVVAAVRRDEGGPVDVTDQVHPDVAVRAVEAARVVGLDVAGVDVVAPDLGQPLEAQGGVVTGVDARPDLAAHLEPAAGTPRPVGEALVAHVMPEGQTGRIPIAAVTGVNGKTTTTRLLAHLLGRGGRCVGMTCTEGIYVDGRRIEAGDCSGPGSARVVLQHPRVEAAVLETARGGILRAGLGFDRCDVAMVTNIADGDHLGQNDVDTPEQLARVKRVVVEAVAPTGAAVLRADDPLVEAMAAHCPGSIVFFARDGAHPVLARHRAARGRAAFVRDRHLVLAEGDQEIRLVALDKVPLTHGGRVGFQVLNALAAAAAAWSLGVPCEAIRVGLESFAADMTRVPGRFNLLDVRGATVVVDYGHNAASLACLLETLEQLPHRRRLAVYSTAGDRRDCDLVRQGELLGNAFDRVLLYEDHYTRGRPPGEIIALFRKGAEAGRRAKEIQEVRGALKAIETALRQARPGDLLLVQADVIEETVEYMRRHLVAGDAGREITFAEAIELGRPEAEPVFAPEAGRHRSKEAYAPRPVAGA